MVLGTDCSPFGGGGGVIHPAAGLAAALPPLNTHASPRLHA